jgi:hypothetical protein
MTHYVAPVIRPAAAECLVHGLRQLEDLLAQGTYDGEELPRRDCTGRIAVVQTGVVENAAELHDLVASRGHLVATLSDAEVIAHLLEQAYIVTAGHLSEALGAVCRELKGTFTVIAAHSDHPDVVVGAWGGEGHVVTMSAWAPPLGAFSLALAPSYV